MPTTSTEISRSKILHPDENHDGGSALHGKVATLLTKLGDNASSRYSEHVAIADNNFVTVDHNFGANLAELTVLIFSGTGATKQLILDTATAGYAITEEAGFEETVVRVTTPGSGGPHTFSVVIVDAELKPFQLQQLLASTPGNAASGTLRKWLDANGRGLSKTATGVVGTQQSLTPIHTAGPAVTALPGFHYIIDSSGAVVTVTLPAAIADYDRIRISDATKSFNTNKCTVARNGNSIDGAAADYDLTFPGDWIELTGDNTNSNWIADLPSAGASTGGESGTNYFTNGNFENDATTGVSNDGGGTPVQFAEEIGTPLYGARSCLLTSQAGTGHIDFDIGLIDTGVVDAQIVTQISAHLKTDALVADGDWTAGVYDTVGAAYVVAATALIADKINIYRTPFVPLFVTADRYTLRVEFTDSTAGRTVIADKLVMTPDSNSGLINPAPEFYLKVHAGNGHGSTDTKIRRFSSIDANYNNPGTAITYAESAANGSTFTINEDGIYDLSYNDGTNATLSDMGITVNSFELSTSISSVSGGNIVATSASGEGTGSFGNIAASRQFSAGDVIRAHTDGTPDRTLNSQVQFTITQVQRFTQKVNLLTQDVVTANSNAIFYNATPATADGSSRILFDSTEENNGGGFTLDTVNRRVICNFTGKVEVLVDLAVTAGSLGAARINLEGVKEYATGIPNSASQRAISHAIVPVVAGQQISIKDAGGATYGGALWDMSMRLTRKMDYGAFSPVGFALATPTQAGLNYAWRGFFTEGDASGAFTTDVFKDVIGQTVVRDPFSGFNTGTGEYTIPAGLGGLWKFDYNFAFANLTTDGGCDIRLMVNGTPKRSNHWNRMSDGVGDAKITGNMTIVLVAGEVIKFEARHSDNVNRNSNGNSTDIYFSGRWLTP